MLTPISTTKGTVGAEEEGVLLVCATGDGLGALEYGGNAPAGATRGSRGRRRFLLLLPLEAASVSQKRFCIG